MAYKRILLAIDQDEVSLQALLETIQLVKTLQAELMIIHVIDEVLATQLKEQLVNENELTLYEKPSIDFLNKVRLKSNELGVSPEIQILKITNKDQRISFEIVDAAKKWSADLLVIGAYSRTGVHKLLLGHVAENIIRTTDLPILILHTRH